MDKVCGECKWFEENTSSAWGYCKLDSSFVLEDKEKDCFEPKEEDKPKNDDINYPKHYTQGTIEPIDFIESNKLDYFEGNVVKYVARYKHKGQPLKDLKKAEFYLKRLIKEQEVTK